MGSLSICQNFVGWDNGNESTAEQLHDLKEGSLSRYAPSTETVQQVPLLKARGGTYRRKDAQAPGHDASDSDWGGQIVSDRVAAIERQALAGCGNSALQNAIGSIH